ncbi:MAG: STM4011 family radical SAM protein [Planctomycetaceae bacterium]|nr:STM4011 family radical SAM protein [Planctomycetaceae bacterium]
MATDLTILYRGCLADCNYSCWYCPQAKTSSTPKVLHDDRLGVERFVDWAQRYAGGRLSVFFTPWGEALWRPWYQQAIARLSHMNHVRRVAVQTNLSCNLTWVGQCRVERVGLWCTYHPSQTSRRPFLLQCAELSDAGVAFSVGMVAVREHFDEIRMMRQALPAGIYLWLNAYKHGDYYQPQELAALTAVDPLLPMNVRPHVSLGRLCRCGSSLIAVDHTGTFRRCHFIAEPLGNIYNDAFEDRLRSAPCTKATCSCHIGYIHLADAAGDDTYGGGILERIPRFIGRKQTQ